MKSKLLVCISKMGLLAIATTLCLYGEFLTSSLPNSAGLKSIVLMSALQDHQTQWMISACVGIYLLIFLTIRCRHSGSGVYAREFWLAIVLFVSAFAYISDYQAAGRSMRFLTFLTVIALGQSAFAWIRSERSPEKSLRQFLMVVLTLLAIGVFWQSDSGLKFKYHGHVRWSGPWNNPNIYGLLMGVGCAVSCGLLAERVIAGASAGQPKSNRVGVSRFPFGVIYLLVIAVIMFLGLVKSGSRGAWLATMCAILYLGLMGKKRLSRGEKSWPALSGGSVRPASVVAGERAFIFQRSPFAWVIICFSLVSLLFWPMRHAKWDAANRFFSAVNRNDFSLRNRLGAWEGSFQMMADRPWQGFGWNRTWQAYGSYFNDTKIEDPSAVQTNAYLVFGTTLGLPAMLALLIYISMILRLNLGPRLPEYEGAVPVSEISKFMWTRVVCHAGAIALIIGFWFDGGLFELPTAALFWILLELGIPTPEGVRRLAGEKHFELSGRGI